ncbi:MAG: hypothetical protein AAGC72_17895 [Planctomycetota bacterium]
MVGWLYIDGIVAAPIRVLDTDAGSGMLSLAIAKKFVNRREPLRGSTLIEYRGWQHRREVRCLSAEVVGDEMLIDAVDLGMPDEVEDGPGGPAEDWLVLDGRPLAQVHGFRAGGGPGTVTGHCVMRVPLAVWRDLRVGDRAPLSGVGVPAGVSEDGAMITPLLQRHAPVHDPVHEPVVEVVRLRERLRYRVVPLATDWCEDATLLVCRVDRLEGLG